ncbi:MAG: 2-amino-4-hydroxy-6-hydroxymethyldihydropteridine diphosphokinase [Methylococcaceae bacterium]|nr:2-amino-4-hydroxy-6-hydroxymethyldihydropteridine diphosphokinase [Prolixibacteraceae bacterium]
MSKVYLLLGGNIGDKQQVFAQATSSLGERVGKITGRSAIYETEPWGFESNDLFWNQVLELEVDIPARKVLEMTMDIEHQMGRIRKINQYDSRVIDIDILFYDDKIIEMPELVIPHPRIQERKFVLVPLDELVPDMIHPVLHKSIHQLLEACKDELRVERVKDL